MRYIIIILLTAGLFACKREFDPLYDYKDITNTANVKFVHTLSNLFADPANPLDTVQSGLQVYYNDQKLTGNNIGYRGVFPALEYSKITAGNVTVKWVRPAGNSNPETLLKDTTVQLQADATYSFFLLDTLPKPRVLVIKEEELNAVADSGKFFLRLINLTTNSAGYDLIDSIRVNSVPIKDTLLTNIANGTASSFIQVDVGAGSRWMLLRNAGTEKNLVRLEIAPTAGRMYTLFTTGIADFVKEGRLPKMSLMTTRFQTMNY